MSRRVLAAATAALVAVGLAACSPEESATETSGSEGADAQVGADLDVAAYDAVIASGPVADDATVEANAWASAVREAGVLEVGGTETSNLFSLLDPTADGTVRGFDAGLSQLLSQYILGEVSTELTQVSVDTREELLVNGDVDTVFATYSITPERAERVGFAGPYYSSQAGILVNADNEEITSLEDLAGKTVATQAGSTGETLLESEAPEAEILALPDHAQALEAVINGNADAYVIDETLLLNAVLAQGGTVKIVGDSFGPEDLYGIGVPLESDAVEFINAFLEQIEADGVWEELWQVTIGDRTGVDTAPDAPTPGETGL
ncbi:transporter substrate-binding domain-containing protein [Serinibacter salmoneus]|uniref:Amino acid ABC transporter substrate-binding protein (PAAT family) n=1 Tax=Serinibacter salmoneus TaxID=556530 RepID=A0A2A9D485_9MICO|nr:transporter substrate-binding domain-containing protein [Serinibacter salmoneus]PFG20772.1 amino acid ABC transporter substrate-binding protein (PAAT family) [Serinibacter salmoneus]